MLQQASIHSHTEGRKSNGNGAASVVKKDVKQEAEEAAIMAVAVLKFSLADMPLWGGPLIERLKREFPYRSEISLKSSLIQWIASPRHFFVRTNASVALATIASAELDPRPYVDVLFLWCEQDRESKRAGARLCREIDRWCKAMRAKEVVYSGSVDFQHNDMCDFVGVSTGRTVYYRPSV